MFVEEAVLPLHLLNAMLVKIRQLFRSFDIVHVLEMALGEDEVDLFERAPCGLGIVDVYNRQEARVDDGEEEVSSPACVSSATTREFLMLFLPMLSIITGVIITTTKLNSH